MEFEGPEAATQPRPEQLAIAITGPFSVSNSSSYDSRQLRIGSMLRLLAVAHLLSSRKHLIHLIRGEELP